MADQPKEAETAENEATESTEAKVRPKWWRRLLTKRWLPILCVVTLLLHGLMLFSWRSALSGNQEQVSEIELGEFRFINSEKNARLCQAEFDIHVSLLLGTERAGSKRLAEKRYLVQQGIEELLRQAHAADFEDPTLAELKRQIQEKINESVEMRTVDTVIITNLEKSSGESANHAMPASTEFPRAAPMDSEAQFEHSPTPAVLDRTASMIE